MTAQDRYLAHQLQKKATLMKLMKERHSTRLFTDEEIEPAKLNQLLTSIDRCPSSCDRRAISLKVIDSRDDKAILGGMLVGGVGWIHRANKIILLFADHTAYKERLVYMPYLDAGVVIYHLYLMTQALGLKGCYVNPNVREAHQPLFKALFGADIFCGAFGVGYGK